MNMDAHALKVLRDLQYRIKVSDESDPERANAIRVRDRLLAKYGVSLEGNYIQCSTNAYS